MSPNLRLRGHRSTVDFPDQPDPEKTASESYRKLAVGLFGLAALVVIVTAVFGAGLYEPEIGLRSLAGLWPSLAITVGIQNNVARP